MLDSLIFGEIGNSNLEQCLREMDTDWYVGLEKEREWTSAVLESKPKLFSLGHNDQVVEEMIVHSVFYLLVFLLIHINVALCLMIFFL